MLDFNTTVLPHMQELQNRARRLTNNRADADDLVQNTLMRALRHWGKFTDQGNGVRPWLFRAMYRECINMFRGKKAAERKHTASAAEVDTDDSKMLDVLDTLLPDEVVRALDSLCPEYRSVVERVDLAGDDYSDAAKHLDIKIGTVMSRLHRGRKILRKTLQPYAASIGINVALG